jgi:hypothetical protein
VSVIRRRVPAAERFVSVRHVPRTQTSPRPSIAGDAITAF